MTMTGVTVVPPCPPESTKTKVFGALTAPIVVKVEAVGRWFEAHIHRRHHHHLSYTSGSHGSDSSSDSSDDDLDYDDDDSMLLNLDPKDWKNQDHYAVLGLSRVRYKATADDIKRAYKRKVLKHHPDKRKPKDGIVKPRQKGDDDYFSCITKAYEILGNRISRRSYDSIDHDFDDNVPSVNANSKENFFAEFANVFERNASWSKKKRVPLLGNINASFEEVNKFYQFWYDFDSWREFSYLDEEGEKGENREERRWIEKQNKASRQSRKKEETARMRLLVDNAYACDPRIKRFKEEEREKKAAEKRAKQEAVKALQMEREREKREALEAERLTKEKEEDETRAKALAAKKEREAAKKILKKERKMLRDVCKKNNYYAENEADRVKHMADAEMLCEKLAAVRLQSLNEALSKSEGSTAGEVFCKQVCDLNAEIEKENEEDMRRLQESQSSKATSGASGGPGKNWTNDDVQLLVKAVKMFPAGTVSRYEVIANFINQHSTSTENTKTAKDVINKTKNLQKLDSSKKEEVNKRAFDKFEQMKSKSKKSDVHQPSERFDVADRAEEKKAAETEGPKPWSTDEQKRLEQALKTYPASTKERWDRIAETVSGRSKKECMLRYKELVEMVKAKKAAQAAVGKK